MNRLARACAALLLALSCLGAWAQVPQPPEIAARSYLLMDVTAQQMLAGRDVDSPVEPGSLAQLMTQYLVFDALRAGRISLQQTLPVSARAAKMPGARMFLDPSMQVPVDDLVKGMVVQSANDATVALAEGVGGSVEHFVQLMNDQARALGMVNTTYRNPEGLAAPGQTTTARDLGILAARILQDFPEDLHYYAMRKYRYQGTPTANDTSRNLLLFRDPTVDGMKAAHTEAAGYCLVASASRDFPNLAGRRLLAIVLGTGSDEARAGEAQKLLNWGYTAFEGIKLFEANQPVVTPEVWKGTSRTLKLGRPQALVVAVPAGTAAQLKTVVARPDPLVAPYARGQRVGTLKVMAGDRTVAEVPLLALDAVDQAGVLGRAWDAVRLWIR